MDERKMWQAERISESDAGFGTIRDQAWVVINMGSFLAPSQDPGPTRSRVLLVEDSALVRQAIYRILADTFHLLGWVDDGRKVLETARRMEPDVIILDISLPGISGMILLPHLRRYLPAAAIVMLTNHDSQDYVDAAYRDGADGYVLKCTAHETLVPSIQRGCAARPIPRNAGGDAYLM